MKKKYLETGIIVGTHGIKGELRVQPWCDSPEFLTAFKTLYLDEQGTQIEIASARVHKNIVLLMVKGIDTIEKAESMRGKTLYLSRDDLSIPKGSFLQADIIGCRVYDATSGALYGEISEVSQTGANDVWHIKNGDREYLVPSIPDIVKSVDIDKERVEITPIKGLFEDEN